MSDEKIILILISVVSTLISGYVAMTLRWIKKEVESVKELFAAQLRHLKSNSDLRLDSIQNELTEHKKYCKEDFKELFNRIKQ